MNREHFNEDGSRKVRYHSRAAAKTAARAHFGKSWRGLGFSVYSCAACQGFHLGHSQSKRKDAA